MRCSFQTVSLEVHNIRVQLFASFEMKPLLLGLSGRLFQSVLIFSCAAGCRFQLEKQISTVVVAWPRLLLSTATTHALAHSVPTRPLFYGSSNRR